MKHDEIDNRPPLVDLMYPNDEKREQAKKRFYDMQDLPQDYVANLEIEKLSEMLNKSYQYKMKRLFCEMSNDIDVINYRLDVLEDFIRIPKLATLVHQIVGIMTENDRNNIYKINNPDSFTQLDSAVTAYEAYLECMEIMHGFFVDNKDKIQSDGVKKLFGYFEEHHSDVHYSEMKQMVTDLRKAMKERIKSVTVAINFDENLVPESVGIVDFSSEKVGVKPSLLDRIVYYNAKFPQKTVKKNLIERYKSSQEQFGNDKTENEIDRKLFKELDEVTKKYVKTVDKVLEQYQMLGLQDLYTFDYQLEFYIGAVKLVENARAKGLPMCRPKILPASEHKGVFKGVYDMIYFNEACIHNLTSKDKVSVVTNDISFDSDCGFYVLTGANNGGKTTFLRGVGICQLMAQTGLFVPCEECELSPVDYIYTHFPKEEKTGIDSSRFTMEMKEFKTISDTITENSMLLMNESIQSTTPKECVEIAGKLMRIFCKIGVHGIFATHLNDLAYEAEKLRQNDKENIKSKPESIVVTVNEDTGERKYKIKKAMPSDTSFAETVFEKFGINEAEILKKHM